MIYDFYDYLQHDLQITDDLTESDSPYIFPEPIAALIRKANLAVSEKNGKHIEKKLKKWIEEYPQVPMFKNILSGYYSGKGKNEQAFNLNHFIIQQHPDYIFGKLNLIEEYLFLKDFGKIEAILGPSPNIVTFTNNRHVFHYVEYAHFHKILIRYWMATSQTENVLDVFNNLEKLENEFDEDLDLYDIDDLLCEAGIKDHYDDEDQNENYVRTTPTLPQTTIPPIFNFPQIQWLYENSFTIEKEKLEELLKLPREPLVNDLCEVLYDAIRRYDYFSELEFDVQTHSSTAHALFLLMELKAAEALPAALELFRQPEEVLEFWLGDLLTDNIWQVIYAIGQTQLPVLEAFLKEPLNYTYSRTSVSTAISQLALHHPTRRQEVVELYERLLHFYFEKQDDTAIVELDFTSLFLSDIVDFNGTELTPLIKQFYDANLVDMYLYRSWEECLDELNTPDDQRTRSEKRPLQSLFEIRDELYKNELSIDDEMYTQPHPSSHTPLFQPFIHTQPKTGRNAPCPCGSGKKYKKCCGKGE